ncbi:Fasciclin-like arabinogalactan family protein [Perilla frutescens var. hirtella]|nr:Fasciclin-like arabinogalactan family protein [Perilla frutescens var. hirtella]KAH6815387.1 Fasciclin-like arabinogalactan family protein [Perilla frutescens var. frutescens]
MAVMMSSAAGAMNEEILIASEEMQRANYFTFVMLLNMAPINTFEGNFTFLMPNDRALANTTTAATSVLDFLLRHSIPSPLLIDHLEHFPTGSMIPTSEPGFMFKVSNDGRRRFFLSNVRITSPNICTLGTSIRCHGIDGVVQPAAMVPLHPNIPLPPTPTCNAVPPPPDAGPVQAPAMIAAPSPSQVSRRQKSASSYRSTVVDLLIIYFVIILWLSVCS